VLLELFDRDGDGALADGELVLDSEARVATIRERLVHLGVGDPAIVGELLVHPVRHGVVDGEHALRDCQACHAPDSRLTMAMAVANGPLPGGVMPVATAAARERLGGRELEVLAGGALRLSTGTLPPDRYVLGQARSWSDALGLLVFAATLLGIAVHAGLRIRAARRHPVHVAAPTARVYMYGAYERVWHWLMAFSVLLLLVTGFRIHFPASLPFLGYPTAVFLHDAVAAVFIVNAFLSFFYHVTTAEIRQFIPAGAGLFERIAVQARYYVQGIFQRAAHPLARTPEAKLNPLQQVTYFGLLNVLFPLQIVTGTLMWVGGRWPELTAPVGGLAIVAPVHNLGSWLFLTFLVMHVYLTTTGHTLTSNLKAMVDGWDEVEAEPTAARAVAAQSRGVEHV
jgi:thiosulfate reductase cytochrome b subunit